MILLQHSKFRTYRKVQMNMVQLQQEPEDMLFLNLLSGISFLDIKTYRVCVASTIVMLHSCHMGLTASRTFLPGIHIDL